MRKESAASGSAHDAGQIVAGTVIWQPSPDAASRCRLARYRRWLAEHRCLRFTDYHALWQWSVTDLPAFWSSLWQYFGVRAATPYEAVLRDTAMPGARWFEGATLNYAEHALGDHGNPTALIYRSEDGRREELSRAELRQRVAATAQGMRRLGVRRGDRVAAYISNVPEAVVAMLAAASLGAIWSSCSTEFGAQSVLDRFQQIEPRVLIVSAAYRYAGRCVDRTAQVRQIAGALRSLNQLVVVERDGIRAAEFERAESFDELGAQEAPLGCTPVPFDHPLWIVYSSGTTGPPKPIVHGHGGILLEHLKALALHSDLAADDRFLWYTTTGWMMWNYLIGGLLTGATIVLYDGSASYPDLRALWSVVVAERVSYFGTSAPFVMACRKARLNLSGVGQLAALRALGSTGAPLPVEGFAWLQGQLPRVQVQSLSGGTDVCTAFVLGCPELPVRAGEIQCRGLGAKVEAFDELGCSVVGRVGELVLTAPLPSMPVRFWADTQGERYRSSYFSHYPGVWRHGDWIEINGHGGVVISGRSDSTLNRQGIRIGTSELYRVVEVLPEIVDSLVVAVALELGQATAIWLFVVLHESAQLDTACKGRIIAALREHGSPRHIPDRIIAVPAVPRTLNGKKLEVPVTRILMGTPTLQAVDLATVRNPEALRPFEQIAARRRSAAPRSGGSA